MLCEKNTLFFVGVCDVYHNSPFLHRVDSRVVDLVV